MFPWPFPRFSGIHEKDPESKETGSFGDVMSVGCPRDAKITYTQGDIWRIRRTCTVRFDLGFVWYSLRTGQSLFSLNPIHWSGTGHRWWSCLPWVLKASSSKSDRDVWSYKISFWYSSPLNHGTHVPEDSFSCEFGLVVLFSQSPYRSWVTRIGFWFLWWSGS